MVNVNLTTIAIVVVIALSLLCIMNMGGENMEGALSYSDKMGYYSDEDLSHVPNPRVWGTVPDKYARWENLSLRPEYQGDLKDGSYKKGVPGDTHVCPCGPPSKRTVDAYGGSHHSLTHLCEPCAPDQYEPVQLGTWWTRKGCGDPTSVGLSQRPYCTDC